MPEFSLAASPAHASSIRFHWGTQSHQEKPMSPNRASLPPADRPRRKRPLARVLTLASLAPAAASAQISFSIDWQSPPVGIADPCFGIPITEGDILVPPFFAPPMPGPLPPPCIAISGGMGPPAPGLSMFP